MSEQQREKNIKQLTNFSKTSLKNKLHLAIEKNDPITIDQILLTAKENNFDLINHINTNDDNYHTTMDSVLKAYIKILNDKEKELKKSYSFFNKDRKADFSLINSLIDKGLDFNSVYIVNNKEKDIFDVLFRFDFDKLSGEMKHQLKDHLIAEIPVEYMSLSRYINLVNSYSFLRTPKGKNRYEEKNVFLFNGFLSKHINNNIPLQVNIEDLKPLFYLVHDDNYAIKKDNIKGILNLFSTETLLNENNLEYMFRLLIETNDKEYILDFLAKHQINFNEEMNKKYSVKQYGSLQEELPLMAKLIVQSNSKIQRNLNEDDILTFLSDHFDFKYIDTPFSSVFKEEYYMSYHSCYYNNQNSILERMIDKGMDFYSENLNSGTNIFDYAFSHSSSRFFMNYLFEKNKLDVDYINPRNKTLIDTLIISNEISYLKKGQTHNRENNISSGHYFFEILNKKYENSFIPDAFFNDAFKHSKSYYAKIAVYALSSKARPDFKNPEIIFPSGNNFSYFDDEDLKNQFTSRESTEKGQNFLHTLFQNKEGNNIIQILNKIITLGSLAWLEKDKDGHNPFYYLKKRNSFWSINYNFEDFIEIANKMPAEFFLSQKNSENIPVVDILASYFSFNNEDQIKYISVIEKKKLEFSLSLDSPDIDSGVNKKKRL